MGGTGIPFDRVADIYDDTRGYPDIVMNDILRVMQSELPEDRLILDAGTGTGRFAGPLQARDFHVVGIDIADKMINIARKKGTEAILKGNICSMPFQDDTFDTTISIHVLHLIADWRRALKEIARVTKTNLVSVISNREKSPAQDLRKEYERLCGALGHPMRPPGLRERELQGLLRPDLVRRICVYVHSVNVEQFIDIINRRLLSVQWSVPDEIHLKAIEGVRMRFKGVVQLPEIERISLVQWGIDRIREFAGCPAPDYRLLD